MNNKDLDKKLAKWEAKAKTAIKYIAVDASGSVWGYDAKPKVERFAYWYGRDGYAIRLGTTEDKDLRKNWDKTLRKVIYE